MKIESMLCRKVIAASGTSLLISFLLAFNYVKGIDFNTIGWWTVYLMYSGPIIIIYGTLASFISDIMAGYISKKIPLWPQLWPQRLFSLLFHIAFGLILWQVSMIAAVIFFVLDNVLDKRRPVYSMKRAAVGLGALVGCWLYMILLINFIG
ncbi:hypothetical protein ACFSMW_08480 [Virgibacillus halophilus]|uniref:Uncharacterized protein n=1 Tax=Tigheibacillus halophilus TaxID=361280 RepID=A0ABU5C520_9BACI|nr:hypothetical protein [Virgibacillus halophilus]